MMAKVTQAHVDARRSDILNAAVGLFSSQGWQNTSMQEVAKEAGISTGAIYRYYPSKDELLRAAFADTAATISASFDEDRARATSPLDALRRIGGRVLSFPDCPDPSMQLESALGSKRDPEHWGRRRRELTLSIISEIEPIVREGQAIGEINPDLDPSATAQVLYTLVPGVAALWVELGEEPDIEAILDTVIALLKGCREGSQSNDA